MNIFISTLPMIVNRYESFSVFVERMVPIIDEAKQSIHP